MTELPTCHTSSPTVFASHFQRAKCTLFQINIGQGFIQGGRGGGGGEKDRGYPPKLFFLPKNFHNRITLECSVHVLITLEWL